MVFGVRSQFSSSQPAAGPDLPWDPCPLPLADWVERDSQQQEEGGSGPAQEGWLGWEPVSQSLEIRSPTVISFFPPSLFPTRKGLMLLINVAHPSEKACLHLAGGLSGDGIAPGAGTTPVLASSHHLLTPSPQALQKLKNQYILSPPAAELLRFSQNQGTGAGVP